MARSVGAENMLLKSDSKLVIRQINGEYEAKESKILEIDEPNNWGVREGELHANITELKLKSRQSGKVCVVGG